MKALLDTTFLLPFINVEPENLSKIQLKRLLDNNEHTLVYCELSIFELVAKGMKICFNSQLTIEDIHKGIDSLIHRSPIRVINWISHPNLLQMSFKIKKIHSDTFDCLIFSTALFYSDCFVTIDHTLIKKLKENQDLYKEIISINPNFYVWLDGLKNTPILFSKWKYNEE